MDDGTVIVMSDVEIAEALVGARSLTNEGMGDSYHQGRLADRFDIVDGVIYLGGMSDFYAYPLTIDHLRLAFDIRRPATA